MDLVLLDGVIAGVDIWLIGAKMRAINNLTDVQIVLKDLLDKKDRDLVKAKDQRGNQIKNAGDAVDPQDLVTLRQLQDELRKFKKVITQTIVTTPGSGTGSPPPTTTPPPVITPPPITGPNLPGIPVSETPTGSLDGFNTIFSLSQLPIANTLNVRLNGVRQSEPDNIIINNTTIQFMVAPKVNDDLIADYYYK